MARIIENGLGRRMLKLNSDDVISIIREYQTLVSENRNKKSIRELLNNANIYLPEDL